jgi:hypothetical protein
MKPGMGSGRLMYQRYQAWWRVQVRPVQWAVLLGLPGLLVALWWSGWYAPQWRRLQAVTQTLAETQVRQGALAASQKSARQESDRAQRRLAQLKDEIAQIEADLESLRGHLVAPEAMRERLAGLVERSGAAQWVGLTSAPVVVLPKARLFRHPFSLELHGDFESLLAAVRAIEYEAQTVHWSVLELQLLAYPRVRAQLNLYTLSEHKTWLSL